MGTTSRPCSSTSEPPSFLRSMFLVLGTVAATATAQQQEDVAVAIPSELPEIRALDRPRAERFPTREERVQLYMSNWYLPPCEGYSEGRVSFYELLPAAAAAGNPESDEEEWPAYHLQEAADIANHTSYTMETSIEPDTAFVLDRATLLDCAVRSGNDPRLKDRVQFRSNMYMYCLDVAQTFLPALDHVQWEVERDNSETTTTVLPPAILQFGDLKHSHVYQLISLPHFKKFRIAASPEELERVTTITANKNECYDRPRDLLKEDSVLQPIIWKLATRRHYGLVPQVIVKDRPWDQKKDMAVFRGQLTGSRDGFDKHRSPVENCLNLRRCRLVYNHANSTLVNARLTDTRGRLPDVLNGVTLTTSSVTMRHLLRYKGIVMLEGNDVASGLKWALLSDSVVLMPLPKHTSWVMEELLQPWVHYVPLNEEATDVERKMQWILDHQDVARRIAAAATLWMQDLVFHPDAADDDRWIQEEMVRRYSRHFVPAAAEEALPSAAVTT